MSETPRRRPKLKMSVSEVLLSLRQQSGLTQDQLAALSFELADQTGEFSGITQQALSRIEANPEAAPHVPTLKTLAIVLAHALNQNGYSAATEDVIFRQFQNARHRTPASRNVSEQAAMFDADLSIYPEWYRDMIWSIVWQVHIESSAALREQRKKTRRTTDYNNSDISFE